MMIHKVKQAINHDRGLKYLFYDNLPMAVKLRTRILSDPTKYTSNSKMA